MYEVLKYIHEHIAERLDITEVSSIFGYSKWNFCRSFRTYTGKGFVEYVRNYRIQLAAIDIVNGKKVSDAAFDYGYDSLGGFNKAFISEYGCYSSEYKKNYKNALLYYERRKINMFPLSDRVEILRENAMKHKYDRDFSWRRNVYFHLGTARAAKEGLDTIRQMGQSIAQAMVGPKPYIMPHELIVGINYSCYYEMWCGELPNKDDPDMTQVWQENEIPQKDVDELYENWNSYVINSNNMRLYMGTANEFYPELTQLEKDRGEDYAECSRCVDCNHTVIGLEDVVKYGFSGLLKKVEAFEEKNGKNSLYEAAKDICLAGLEYGKLYAKRAQELLDSKNPEYDEEDLKHIIKVCNNVPANPATTFEEALQAFWFAHIINTFEDGINANSLGRLDQIFYPYYKNDIEKGILTKEKAFELLCCLWIKLYRDYDVQQQTIGGVDENGKSVVNELSYLMLDVTERLDFVRCISARISHATEKHFVERCLEVVGHVQKGFPYFYNDDVLIPALEDHGVSHKDACNYANLGCVETVIPGKTNPHAVTSILNLAKALEYVFTNGSSMMYPQLNIGLITGDLNSFKTYESFEKAVFEQIDSIYDIACAKVVKWTYTSAHISPRPYKSLLTEGCLENQMDFNARGALYDYYQMTTGGIPNLADSLEVIKKFVYEDKKYTLAEIKEILENNFPDEAVRQEFINKAPKYGNDIQEVDEIAVRITNHCADVLEKYSKKYNLDFHLQPFTFYWMIDMGRKTAATPDGRRKGEDLAYSVSPVPGRDFNGLTAAMNSISKLPTKRTPAVSSAIIEVDPKLFTDANIPMLADILMTACSKGLSNVQFNCIDAETLMDAQKNPEKYNNLAVRVTGFSQKFNLLSPELQNHVIGRTKHKCL